MPTRWTDDEDRYLASHSKSDLALLASVLDRSTEAVRTRLYKLSREPEDGGFIPVEMKFFLERANRPAPGVLRELPKSAIPTAGLAAYKPGRSRTRGAGNPFRHTKTGFRPDINITARSGWEANVARILTSYEIPWDFEPAVFTFPIKRGNKAYTPDFYLPGTDEWIEVKGYFDNNTRIKMKRFKKYYPTEWAKLTMIVSKGSKASREFCSEMRVPNTLFYQDIANIFRTRIKNWEG